ncbi:unnamed protein product [Sympodiomycopsis kandeliae]
MKLNFKCRTKSRGHFRLLPFDQTLTKSSCGPDEMQDFTSQLLRAYFASTDWHPYNSYLHLTSFSSSILLDFPIPSGLSFSISSSPSPIFYSTHKLRALPQLAGSLGYVFASTDRPLVLGHEQQQRETSAGGNWRLQDVLERFRIVNVPSRAHNSQEEGKDGIGRGRDYLLYGCIHAPTARLDALYTTRIAPTWNLIVTACSFPPRQPSSISTTSSTPADQNAALAAAAMATSGGSPGATNLQLTLQNDTGKWFNEFSYSVDDALWGFRTMHHFGSSQRGNSAAPQADLSSATAALDSASAVTLDQRSQSMQMPPAAFPANLRADEDSSASEVGGGLKGRFSAGAELFFSASEKSAGLSTGVRFTTLPEEEESEDTIKETSNTPPPPPSQPPTTITATLNPMMGHLSTAYAARMGKNLVACSRYDFNVYSYESELTVGGEYWLRRSIHRNDISDEQEELIEQRNPVATDPYSISLRERQQQKSSSQSVPRMNLPAPRTNSGAAAVNSNPIDELAGQIVIEDANNAHEMTRQRLQPYKGPPPDSEFPFDSPGNQGAGGNDPETAAVTPSPTATATLSPVSVPSSSTSGLLKWSLNSSLLLSLLWQGRLRNCLVAVGIKADLGGGVNVINKDRRGGMGSVIRGIGMDIVYWGGGGGDASDVDDAGIARTSGGTKIRVAQQDSEAAYDFAEQSQRRV